MIVRTIPILMSAKREQRRAALQLPAIALFFAALGWLLEQRHVADGAAGRDAGDVRPDVPAARSTGTPLIEHFARMVKPDLSAAGAGPLPQRGPASGAIYLIALAAFGLVLAKFASLAVWTVYVGLVSYGLVGVLFAVEYVVRKLRFRDYGRNPLDWLLSKLFPAPGPDVS